MASLTQQFAVLFLGHALAALLNYGTQRLPPQHILVARLPTNIENVTRNNTRKSRRRKLLAADLPIPRRAADLKRNEALYKSFLLALPAALPRVSYGKSSFAKPA